MIKRRSRSGPCRTVELGNPTVTLSPSQLRFIEHVKQDVTERRRVAKLTYKERLRQLGRIADTDK